MVDVPQRRDTPRVCLKCDAPADPAHQFCGRCGAPLHHRCPSCLSLVAPEFTFCTSCGTQLSRELPTTTAPRQERRTVNVLFVDLKGFTSMAERLDPEDLRSLQLDYFSTAREVIRRYGGVVEKYIGDAVMAVFGVPVETEHDGYRAVLAGLDMQRELGGKALAGRYRMPARVGIATGEALVDLAAARNGGEALLSGDVVATAARLQTQAPPGGVLVSAATHRATAGSIRYADDPARLELAGKSRSVEAWLAKASVRRPPVVDDEGTPLVGRAAELDLLMAAVRRCVSERRAHLVSVVGAHGMGKSRLARELSRRVRDDGELLVRWRVGRCLPYGAGGTYDALAEIVKAHADVLDTDDPASTRERLTATLAEVLPAAEVERLVALLGPLAGLPGRAVRPGEIEAAWRDALLALARHLPTVLVIEDLHFADPAMLRFLADLVEAGGEVPLLVLCTYRPELLDEQPTWPSALPGMLTVSLARLRTAEMRTLLSTLLSQQDLAAADGAERLTRLTGGNPMYAVEYVRMLAERGGAALAGDGELDVPESVHGVIANRIDLLDNAERTVLNAAAVLGDRLWPGAIADMLALDPADVAGVLRRLRRRDLLVAGTVSTVAGEAELSFQHQLVRDVAYRRLPRATRAALHRRAAGWLQRVSIDGRNDLAIAVARHRIQALDLAESLGEDTAADAEAARTALLAAAEAAFAVYAVDAALGYTEGALNAWPAGQEPDARRGAELLHRRLQFLVDPDAFYRDGVKEVARIADRMREAGDHTGEARAETLLGQAEFMRAERDRAREHLDRAIARFAGLPDDAAKAEAYAELARLHLLEFQTGPALPAARAARDLAHRLGLADAEVHALVTEHATRYVAGDLGALDDLERVVETCRAQGLPTLRRALHNLATFRQEEGDLAGAAALERESRAVHGGELSLVLDHSEEAEAAYFSGDWRALLRAADEYLDTEGAGTTDWDLQLRGRRAWIGALCGRPAGEDVARSLDVAHRSGFVRLRYNAYAHGALAHALRGDPDGAAALLADLATLWRETPTALTLEWLSAAAHATVLTPAAAPMMAEVVRTSLRRTRWVEAADALVAGDPAAAFTVYDEIGCASDAALAAVWAARAGDESYVDRIRAFAARNDAAALLRLATAAS